MKHLRKYNEDIESDLQEIEYIKIALLILLICFDRNRRWCVYTNYY
jgi:hypothetical protein